MYIFQKPNRLVLILLECVLIALIAHFRFLVDCKVNKITFFLLSLQPRKLILAKIWNMTNSRKLILAKNQNFFNSRKLISAKYIFFLLAKINTREN